MSLRILVGLIVLVLFTQFQIELNLLEVNIPVTGQTLAVLLVAYVLGLKEGTITILLYLIIGLVGLPVFADGGNGISAFTGNSGGYLIGFLFGGILTGFLSERFRNTFVNSLLAAFSGTCVILLFGVTRLAFNLGISDAVTYGFNPFVLGGIVKILIGGLLGWLIKKVVNRISVNAVSVNNAD
ncbi:biotin transporter BioY [Brumimicrobium mesophilum]|uniref:biotin transporter BioY n=1 Tax=Brumimicrobium mesophilum TaxID=392717 RepID=UPI00131A98EF|nr:biotin transporter BioY [Brumimicrobium mesophilum]